MILKKLLNLFLITALISSCFAISAYAEIQILDRQIYLDFAKEDDENPEHILNESCRGFSGMILADIEYDGIQELYTFETLTACYDENKIDVVIYSDFEDSIDYDSEVLIKKQ